MRYAAPLLLPVDAPIRRARIRLRQRGFTLVELAIALAVVGLLLGASIIPLRALDEARQLRDEQRRLEVVRDAVVGYALRHRTRARTVKFVNWHAPDSAWEFRLPAGRPYLPCPDYDGDGFEDRHGFVQGVDSRPGAVTATIRAYDLHAERGSARRRGLFWDPFSMFRGAWDDDAGPPHGECSTSKGSVPWRTLGVPPTDGWGNRHTYFADLVFSNAIFGFDRQTIADPYDPRLPDAPNFEFALRYAKYPHYTSDRSGGSEFRTNGCPAIICDGGRTRARADMDASGEVGCSGLWRNRSPREASTCGPFLSDNLVLKAGAAAQAAINAGAGEKRFMAGEVTDGLPLVLVSHGPNGRFAVSHWATLKDPFDQDRGEKTPVCNLAGEGLGNHILPIANEQNRALLHEGINGSRAFLTRSGGLNGRCLPIRTWFEEDGRMAPLFFHLSFFAWEPPGWSHRGGFDDLLLWMTREELSLAVPGRIPPLPRMVVAYFP